jgi:two-component system, response regulator PdtaR
LLEYQSTANGRPNRPVRRGASSPSFLRLRRSLQNQIRMNEIRIAVADDHASARHLLVLLLQSLGHEVVYAAVDGADLIEQCLDQSVDLACVDLDMPIMDGLAAAEVLATKEIPVILISGHPDIEHIVAEHEPIVTFLTKPISVEKLRLAIEQAIAARQPLQPGGTSETPMDRPPSGAESIPSSPNV